MEQSDNLKTVIDSLKSIFSASLKEHVINQAPNRFGNFVLYSHQRALIEEMRNRETAFRNGVSKLYSRFAILGDPIGTGKTISSLAYIATCKRVQIPSISPQLHIQSTTNFFSMINTISNTKTNLFVLPNMDLPVLKDILENQDQLTYRIIRKLNHINPELINDLPNIDLIVVPVSQYSVFSQYMIDNNIIFDRCFFENTDNIFLNMSNNHLISNFTWLITHNWFNFIFPETNLFDYGITLDNFLRINYPNLPDDLTHYINTQRVNH